MTLTKDNFPVGTRVRVVKFPDPTLVDARGTVTAGDKYSGPAGQYVFVQRDGEAATDDFPFRPSELEIIRDLTFAIGDRVEYHNAERADHPDNGRLGRVFAFGSYGPGITWDDGDWHLRYPLPENVRHVSEPAADDLAASIRAHMSTLADDLTAVNAEIDTLSAKRDTLRQDIAALKNAAARLEAQK